MGTGIKTHASMNGQGEMDTKRCIKCDTEKALKSFNAGRNV